MRRFILGSYSIAGGCVLASNTTNYQPKSDSLRTHWDFLKLDTTYGKTIATLFVGMAPALVPVYTMTLPLLAGFEYGLKKNKELEDQKELEELEN